MAVPKAHFSLSYHQFSPISPLKINEDGVFNTFLFSEEPQQPAHYIPTHLEINWWSLKWKEKVQFTFHLPVLAAINSTHLTPAVLK